MHGVCDEVKRKSSRSGRVNVLLLEGRYRHDRRPHFTVVSVVHYVLVEYVDIGVLVITLEGGKG